MYFSYLGALPLHLPFAFRLPPSVPPFSSLFAYIYTFSPLFFRLRGIGKEGLSAVGGCRREGGRKSLLSNPPSSSSLFPSPCPPTAQSSKAGERGGGRSQEIGEKRMKSSLPPSLFISHSQTPTPSFLFPLSSFFLFPLPVAGRATPYSVRTADGGFVKAESDFSPPGLKGWDRGEGKRFSLLQKCKRNVT